MVVLTDNRWYSEIGNAIRAKTGASMSYTPSQMAEAIRLMDTGYGKLADCIALGEILPPVAIGLSAEQVVPSAFYSSPYLVAAGFPKVSSIGSYAFYGCSSLSWISFPRCQAISSCAFARCSMLGPVLSLPECISISSQAFLSCRSLRSVYIPKCTSLGASAFRECYSLERIYMPLVSVVNERTFYECSSLTSVTLDNCLSVDLFAFGSTGLTSVYLPNCSYITGYAFYQCSKLSYVKLDAAEVIGGSAFRYCRSLATIDLTSVLSVPKLGTSVFDNTGMYSGGPGRIYVHSTMYERFMESSAWAAYSAYIVSVS